MGEDEDHEDHEPEEVQCERCENSGNIENMVDCPKFSEDLGEDGVRFGYLHRSCCEEEFVDNPSGCIEWCGSQEYENFLEKHFKDCVNLTDLVEKKIDDAVPVFANEDGTLLISLHGDKLLERLKPLNVVTDTFSDEEEGVFYVKDNEKNITHYSLPLVEDIQNRLSSFDALESEMFCKPKGPYCIVYQIGGVSISAMLGANPQEIDAQQVGIDVARRFREKYSDAEGFFGVQTAPNRENVKERIQALSERDLISGVLVPVLWALGFKGVKPVSFHGPGESGGDFHPFYKADEFGKIVYYSAQAKAVKIHANAGIQEGNVNQLISQITEVLRASFRSFIDNTERKVTRVFVFSSKEITADARNQLFFQYENNQLVSLIEIDDIVNAVIDKGLADEIMSYRAHQ